MTDRLSWNQYFIEIARLVATRSTCQRRQVGAVLVKDKRILATGYNGVPSGVEHCEFVGCLRETLNIPSGERHELCRGVHAEQNALIWAAKYGVSTDGATLYCTHSPCLICAKILVQAGVKRVFYAEGYEDRMTFEMLGDELQIKKIGDE